jgi:hypothetical protein
VTRSVASICARQSGMGWQGQQCSWPERQRLVS